MNKKLLTLTGILIVIIILAIIIHNNLSTNELSTSNANEELNYVPHEYNAEETIQDNLEEASGSVAT